MRTNQSLLGSAVILEPATQNDNVVQPLVDSVSAIILRPHSPSQSAPLIGFQGSAGGAISSVVDASGNVSGGSLANAVILAPSTSARNVIVPTVDTATALTIQGHSDSQSAPYFEIAGGTINNSIFAPYIRVHGSGGPNMFEVSDWNWTPGGRGQVTVQSDSNSRPFAVISFPDPSFELGVFRALTGANLFAADVQVYGFAYQSGWSMNVADTNNASQPAVICRVTMPQRTAGATKGQFSLATYDNLNERIVVIGGTTGSAPTIGFLGAPAVAQQANASQAAINAVIDTNAKSALQSIYNLLHDYGLAPATA